MFLDSRLGVFCSLSFQTDGTLLTDNNAGLCQPNAVNTCANRRKRSALPRSPRAGQESPDKMQTRSKLRKRRFQETDDQVSMPVAVQSPSLTAIYSHKLKSMQLSAFVSTSARHTDICKETPGLGLEIVL